VNKVDWIATTNGQGQILPLENRCQLLDAATTYLNFLLARKTNTVSFPEQTHTQTSSRIADGVGEICLSAIHQTM